MALQTYPIPTRRYNPGSASITQAVVPGEATSLALVFDTVNWTDPASRLMIAMEISMDGGVTWVGGGSTDMACRADGTFRDRAGNILSTVSATFTWPRNVTHLRGSIVIEGAAIRTGGSIEVS